MALTKRQFVDHWLKEMELAKHHDRSSYWEAEEAVAELEKKYPRRFTPNALRHEFFINDLVREAAKYESLRTQVAESNKAFEATLLLLKRMRAKALRKAEAMKKSSGPAFTIASNHLKQLARDIEGRSTQLQVAHSNFWKNTLRTYPGKRHNPQQILIALPETLQEWAEGFPKTWDPPHVRYTGAVAKAVERSSKLPVAKREPKRSIDLDKYFQLRFAAILSREFPKLKRTTVARLVVLVCICSKFVHLVDNDKGAQIAVKGTDQPLTVVAVYDRLKRNKGRLAPTTWTAASDAPSTTK